MDLARLKNLFLKIMIGCLIAAGGIAVVTVLTGSFNEIFGKSLITILLIALHALVSFGYIDINQKKDPTNDLSFFHNTTFILIILSFITSIFGVWGVIPGDLVARLYLTYGVLLFAVLHGETLSKMLGNDKTIDGVVHTNYIFMVVVILMLLPVIYTSDPTELGDIYYRLLAAFGIIDAILTLVAIILNKLYLQKHPKVNPSVFGNVPLTFGPAGASNATVPQTSPTKRSGMSIMLIILIGFLAIQLIGGLVVAVIGSQAARNANNVSTNHSASVQTTAPTPTVTSNPNYSYESTFNYNGYSYTCSQSIAGNWMKSDAVTYRNGQQVSQFSFKPANQEDLTNYCNQN